MLKRVEIRSIVIDKTYYCPHTPGESSECRKLKLGIIKKAMKYFDIDLKNSIMIRDGDDMEGGMGRRLVLNIGF